MEGFGSSNDLMPYRFLSVMKSDQRNGSDVLTVYSTNTKIRTYSKFINNLTNLELNKQSGRPIATSIYKEIYLPDNKVEYVE